MEDKVILYLGGGAMAGVFGGGIVTKLQKVDFYDKIKAIYSGSAGSFNAAYFIAKQTEFASSLYYEDLTKGFIHPTKVGIGYFQRYWNKYFYELPEDKIKNVIDIDYFIDIVKKKKKIDKKKIKNSKIPVYVKLLRTSDGKVIYKDLRKSDILRTLKYSVSAVPYYYPKEKENKEYIDGTIAEPIGLKYLLEKYPENKIVIQINVPIERRFRHYAKNVLEGIAIEPMYDWSLSKMMINREKSLKKDIELALKNERVLLVHPPEDKPSGPGTTDKGKLLKTYELGKKEAEKIIDFVN